MHSTINGNPKATRQFMDHGLICECIFGWSWDLTDISDADYYLLEFGNEALKMQQAVKTNGH